MNRNSSKQHLVEGPVTYGFTLRSVTTPHDLRGVLGTAFGHFLLGSHNFMLTASWRVCEVALKRIEVSFPGPPATNAVYEK